jgi:hypothetical protein
MEGNHLGVVILSETVDPFHPKIIKTKQNANHNS